MTYDEVQQLEQKEFEEALRALMGSQHFHRVLGLLMVRTNHEPPGLLHESGLLHFNFREGERKVVYTLLEAIKDDTRVPELTQEVHRYEHRRQSASHPEHSGFDPGAGY